MRLLFVCLGNICRSPLAEGIMRKKIAERNLNIVVDSAGTSDYHIGENPDERAVATAKKFGVDISKLRGRQFTFQDFDDFDRIYAMDHSNYKNITMLARTIEDKEKVYFFNGDRKSGIDVPDPWYGDIEGFIPVFHLLDKTCNRILDELKGCYI